MASLDAILEGVCSDVATAIRAHDPTFEINGAVAKGANGYVFTARNRITAQCVAIKCYYWGGESNLHFEPATLAAVKHRNILEVHHAEVIGPDWALFVTPLCTYGDIDDYIATSVPPARAAVSLAGDILSALGVLHSHRFVHRDLKPGNILIDSSERAIIADFGSVRSFGSGAGTVSGSGHAALYRPPESWATGNYSIFGDIYQVGLVLYQLLGGTLHYDGTLYFTRQQRRAYDELTDDFERSRFVDHNLCSLITRGKLLNLDTMAPWASQQHRKLIRKACAAEPTARFQNAADFQVALHQVLAKTLDWRLNGDASELHLPDRVVRVVPAGTTVGGYCVEQRKSGGWRRDRAYASRDLHALVNAVSERWSER